MSTADFIATNRFGLGARPGELGDVSSDPRGWLAMQVAGPRNVPDVVRSLPSSAEILETLTEEREKRRDARAEPPSGIAAAERLVASIRQTIAPIYLEQVAARYRVAADTVEPFRERLLHFWTNHFAVSADKLQVTALAATLENEVIRPRIAGRFADMLLAAESHPSMILYLDNQASIGPHSTLATWAGRRTRDSGRKLDINENLAREVLELHTLGVNGGYTQADVTSFALALTGWSIGGNRGVLREGTAGQFEFRESAHEPGSRLVLGKHYGQDSVAQPRAILADLAAHPATATHIATKLVRHFVADDPPPGAVERVTRAFRESGGDLPTVHRALIELPEAWILPATKFKTPHEFVVSTFRTLDFVPSEPRQVLAPFQLLGQRPYSPGSPAGWPDTADQWNGPDALLKRIEWATAVGERVGAPGAPLVLAEQALGDSLQDRTRTAISRAASTAQGVTLFLASPEFQRR